MVQATRPVCDYEGSAYRTEFWGRGREYEDGVERAALCHLLPPTGRRLIDIGGGYGRLFPLYGGYEEVVLFDYARSQLQQGWELWGDTGPGGGPRYTYVAGDFYQFPFASGLFDTVVMVRALHHAADAPAVLRGVAQILAPGGTLVLEFANKRNLKAILRHLLRRQDWSPFDREPVEFAKLNFNFHPAWMRERLSGVGLRVRETRTVSHFRVGLLKRVVPTGLLVALDRLVQPTGALCQFSPSVFVRCQGDGKAAAPEGAFFRCTICGSTMLVKDGEALSCTDCGARFAVRDGIYDFKTPLEGGKG
ncbi:MAG: methyltransferase domain-containing protein [Anaerolineae bacterium]|jgi:SAM-dependent methyltransferase/DNA-directed RNA polymerase subunit RPC12/RpoP